MEVRWSGNLSSSPSESEPRGSLNTSVALSPVPRKHNWNRYNQQNTQIGSLTYGIKAITVGKAKWKPLELPLPRKVLNLKQ